MLGHFFKKYHIVQNPKKEQGSTQSNFSPTPMLIPGQNNSHPSVPLMYRYQTLPNLPTQALTLPRPPSLTLPLLPSLPQNPPNNVDFGLLCDQRMGRGRVSLLW